MSEMPDSGQEKLGKWFQCVDWWLLPRSKGDDPVPRFALRDFKMKRKAYEKTLKVSGTRTFQEIVNMGSALADFEVAKYNAQPTWSLRDFRISSREEGTKFVNEFCQCVTFTAQQYCWILNFPGLRTEMMWKKHAWKHVSFEALEEVKTDVLSFDYPPPGVRLDLVGSHDEAEQLFYRASGRDPAAIARLNYLFPSQQDKLAAAEDLLSDSKVARETVGRMPSVRELAAEYVEKAVSFPDSEEAEVARSSLSKLISKGATKRTSPGRSRPRIPYHDESIQLIFMMSYALCKQLVEVDTFLENLGPIKHERRATLSGFYARMLKRVNLELLDFLGPKPSSAARAITAKVLHISPSKVEKAVYSG